MFGRHRFNRQRGYPYRNLKLIRGTINYAKKKSFSLVIYQTTNVLRKFDTNYDYKQKHLILILESVGFCNTWFFLAFNHEKKIANVNIFFVFYICRYVIEISNVVVFIVVVVVVVVVK